MKTFHSNLFTFHSMYYSIFGGNFAIERRKYYFGMSFWKSKRRKLNKVQRFLVGFFLRHWIIFKEKRKNFILAISNM